MTAFPPAPTPPRCLPSPLLHTAVQAPSCLLLHGHLLLQPCPCLSRPTIQTCRPTPLPIIHTSTLASPPAASPSLPGLAQLGVSSLRSRIWLPRYWKQEWQNRVKPPRQSRDSGLRHAGTVGRDCPLEGSGVTFCAQAPFFFVECLLRRFRC